MASKKTTTKLAKATYNNVVDLNQTAYKYTDVDKMEVSDDFQKVAKTCRFFYKRDPIAGTVINKIVDIAITKMQNQKQNCTDVEYEIFNGLAPILQKFYRNVCLEYLLSGLVIPQYEWAQKKGSDISNELDSRRRVWLPDNIWFRDPATIRIEQSPIPNRKYYYVKISRELIDFIKSGGKRKDGSIDKDTYKALIESYPEFVAAVRALKGSKLEVRLEKIRPIEGRTLPENAYPIPYMSNALEALMHKRNLRKMDYSIAARVTASIQLIKLGSDEFPVTDEADFEHIKAQMNYQTVRGNSEKVFQLFANHTLVIEWIFPNTEAMLNQEKYRAVDDDIISGFGFPRTLITGETLRSNVAGGTDIATFSPIATMEAIRDKLEDWTCDLYKEIKEKNVLIKNAPNPSFEAMNLFKLIDLAQIGQMLYQEGSLSRASRIEAFGYDIDTELERKEVEKAKYKEHNIEDAPVLPFSSPQIGQPSGGKPEVKKEIKPEVKK